MSNKVGKSLPAHVTPQIAGLVCGMDDAIEGVLPYATAVFMVVVERSGSVYSVESGVNKLSFSTLGRVRLAMSDILPPVPLAGSNN